MLQPILRIFRLGSGAYSVVRRARHLSSDAIFAVKIVRKPAFPSWVADAMVSRENRLLERLKHVGYAVLDVKKR